MLVFVSKCYFQVLSRHFMDPVPERYEWDSDTLDSRPANCPTFCGTVPHFEIFKNKIVGQSHILEIIVMVNSTLKTTKDNASIT